MAIFSIAIYASPYSSQAGHTAYRFAETLLTAGHHLYRVFFYQDGIQHGTALSCPAQDEFDLVSAWKNLGQLHNIDLVICIAAALKRGLLNEAEATRYKKQNHNLAAGFELSGLGQLIDAAARSDRLITFAD